MAAALAIREESTAVDEVAFFGYGPSRLSIPGKELEVLPTRMVSSSFFSTLGIRPALGRWFLAADNKAIPNNLIVISDRTWRDRFARNPKLIGSALVLDGTPYTVIGIMPRTFAYPDSDVGAWILDPLTLQRLERSELYDVDVTVRLSDGADHTLLGKQLDVIARRVSLNRTSKEPLSFEVQPLRDLVLGTDARLVLLLLLGTHCLLVIVAANFVNLASARGMSRRTNHQVRLALGATQTRLRWEHVIEQLVYAPVTWMLAVGIAALALRLFHAMGSLNVSRADLATIGGDAYLYSACLTFGILFLAGFVGFGRVDSYSSALQENAQGLGPVRTGRIWVLQRASVVIQLCLIVILALIAGSAIKLLFQIRNLPLGFEPRNVLAVAFEPAQGASMPLSASYTILRSILTDIATIPSVEGVAVASFSPLAGAYKLPYIPIQDDTGAWIRGRSVRVQRVSDNYFTVLKIPIIAGRQFAAGDSEFAPCVAMVNRAFVATLKEQQSVVGRVISANGYSGDRAAKCHIVGVAEDARDLGIYDEPTPQVYFSYLQHSDANRTILIRTMQGRRVAARVREILRQHNAPKLESLGGVWEFVDGGTARERLLSYLLLFLAVTGYGVSLMGIVALVEYVLRQRRTEFGIRVALGARRIAIVTLVLREYAVTVGLGIGFGVLSAYGLKSIYATWFQDLPAVSSLEVTLTAVGAYLIVLATVAWPAARVRITDLAALLRGRLLGV